MIVPCRTINGHPATRGGYPRGERNRAAGWGVDKHTTPQCVR